jgi:hypothetical protein
MTHFKMFVLCFSFVHMSYHDTAIPVNRGVYFSIKQRGNDDR